MINTRKRREQIIEQLCRQGAVRVEALSTLFNVSTVDPQRPAFSGKKAAARSAAIAARG